MRIERTFFALLLFVCAGAYADPVWVVRGFATTLTGPCTGVNWSANALVHNRADAGATIRVLHISNNGESSGLTSAVLPAGQSALVSSLVSASSPAPLWVEELDVPAGVAVEGRLDMFAGVCSGGAPPSAMPFAKLALPVFRALTTAGTRQDHFGTDLGGQQVRMNVAVFNAGDVAARAVVTLEQPLCNAVPLATTVTVPADSIVQVPLGPVTPCSGLTPVSPTWSSFVTVVVDQPSFSFVSTLVVGTPLNVSAAVTGN
jgi:hypothetical protein